MFIIITTDSTSPNLGKKPTTKSILAQMAAPKDDEKYRTMRYYAGILRYMEISENTRET
jgi:hypothetical protein